MKHRFSNSGRIRSEILSLAFCGHSLPFRSWEKIPLRIRLLILEHIDLLIKEVLREAQA